MALRGEPVSQLLVDVSAVTDLDTAGIQLLAWFCHQGSDTKDLRRLVSVDDDHGG